MSEQVLCSVEKIGWIDPGHNKSILHYGKLNNIKALCMWDRPNIFFSVTLSSKTWTKGHWPLDDFWPHICWCHMCDSTHGSLCPSPMGIHQCMWIQWSILQNTYYVTYYYFRLSYYIGLHTVHTRKVEQKPGGRGRGRGREWATLGVHPLSWLLSNNQLEKVPFVSVQHTSSIDCC